MFFRFGVAVLLLVTVTVYGTSLETEALALRRQISYQQYQLEILRDRSAELRSQIQQAANLERLLKEVEAGRLSVQKLNRPVRPNRPSPSLLQESVSPDAPLPPRTPTAGAAELSPRR